MTFKEQIKKIKDNWLIAVVVIVLFLFISGGSNLLTGVMPRYGAITSVDYGYEEAAIGVAKSSYYPVPDGDFAPEVEERKVIKTASMMNEVERGEFKTAEAKFKAIVDASDSYLLNENVNKYGKGLKEYYTGYYSIKVEVSKYDAVITQLKEIGEVKSFSEQATDVTERYEDLEIEIEAEKERLKRYKEMYEEATKIEDKINLNDRIFNQERRIKYLEEALENIDKRVDYSSISFRLEEKQSEYANVVWVKLSALVRSFVNSFNSLVTLIFVIVPWVIVIALVTWIVKLVRRKKR
ncbi:DUF4349 domain-containing protein [Candidatus Woesearchaeota archaeon]|nr:DUF4349 domain-containing protein [Candidatus Woesearchaeota archaeon]